MKRQLSLLLLALFALTSFSQEIIPRVGLTLSKTSLSGEPGFEQKFKAGFTFGAGVELKLNSFLSIQPELNFAQKGLRLSFSESDQGISISMDNRTTINYLEVPVLLKAYVSDAKTRFFFLAGLSAGLGLGGKSKSKVDLDFQGDSFSVTVTGKVKFGDPPSDYDPEEGADVYIDNRFDAGLQVGFGAFIRQKFMVEVRYNHGLSNFMDEDIDSKHRTIQFSLAAPFSVISHMLRK
jgi:hypothetical protein